MRPVPKVESKLEGLSNLGEKASTLGRGNVLPEGEGAPSITTKPRSDVSGRAQATAGQAAADAVKHGNVEAHRPRDRFEGGREGGVRGQP